MVWVENEIRVPNYEKEEGMGTLKIKSKPNIKPCYSATYFNSPALPYSSMALLNTVELKNRPIQD